MSKSVLGHLQLLLSADSAQITSDLGKARAAVKTATAGMQGDASKALQVVTTQVQGLGPALRGTQQATAAAMKGLELFGSKGSAAVAGLANGISGLLSGGFTPLGIAIAGASAAIGLFAGADAAKASAAMKAHEESVKDLRDAYQRLAEGIDRSRLEQRATSRGVSPEQQTLEERKREIEAILAASPTGRPAQTEAQRLAAREAIRTVTYVDVAPGTEGMRVFDDLLKVTSDDASKLRGELDLVTKRLAEMEAAAKAAAEATKAAAAAKAFLARQTDFDQTDNPYKGGGFRLSDDEQRDSDSADEARRRLEKAGEEGRAFYFFQEQMAEVEARQRAVNGEAIERIQSANEKATKIKPAEAQRTERNLATTIADLGDLQAALDSVGESAAHALTGGVVDALDRVTQGAMTAKEAFRALAADFARMASKMAMQAALANLFSGAFGIASPTTGPSKGGWVPPATTGAHGGTWRVGGIGGLDSQLVQMRLSPGEMVRVTDGANSRGGDGGPVYVDLSVRPPAVIADDVLARSSPEAKASVVSSAVRRGGRRGERARG